DDDQSNSNRRDYVRWKIPICWSAFCANGRRLPGAKKESAMTRKSIPAGVDCPPAGKTATEAACVHDDAGKNNPRPQLSATEVLSIFRQRWPACFDGQLLKLHIRFEIIAALEGQVSERDVCSALIIYVKDDAYLEKMKKGAVRVDLDGKPAGTVTKEQ